MKVSELMEYMRREVMNNSSSFRMSDLLVDFIYITQQCERQSKYNIFWAIRERGTIITQDFEGFTESCKSWSNQLISTFKIYYYGGGWNIVEINMNES